MEKHVMQCEELGCLILIDPVCTLRWAAFMVPAVLYHREEARQWFPEALLPTCFAVNLI